jgi:hypothetical protein
VPSAEAAESPTLAVPEIAAPEVAGSERASGTSAPRIVEQLAPQSVLTGRFRIVEELGRGGMGIVYRAHDLEVDETVALKVLAPRIAGDPTWIANFKEEMRLARSITHRRICRIHDLGESNGVYFITMQYVAGDSLASLLRRWGRPSEKKTRQIVRQICEGLREAHRAGVVHRDLKPGNILIDQNGDAVIMDFGLARSSTAADKSVPGGIVVGTPGYLSPEQARGEPADPRSDLYSLGCLLYELLAGQPPFTAMSATELIRQHIEDDPVPLRRHRPGVDRGLEWIASRCLEKDPKARLQGAEAVLDALDTGVGEEGLAESHPRVVEMTRFTSASAALAVVAVAALILLGPLYRRASPAAEMRLEFPKAAAISKAREVVSALGHDVSGLDVFAAFERSELDLEHVYADLGPDEARRAAREGEMARWEVTFSRDGSASAELDPGEFRARLDPRGRFLSFRTPPRADSSASHPPRAAAVARAGELVREWLAVDPDGYEVEVVTRSNPPGITEIVWSNRRPVFDHAEIVVVDLQGNEVVHLERRLEPRPAWRADDGLGARAELFIAGIAAIVVLVYVGAAVFLVRGRAWEELRQPTTLMLATTFLAAFLLQQIPQNPGEGLFILLIIPIVAMVFVPAVLLVAGGICSWLRTSHPERMLGMDQLASGRLRGKAAASSLVHGTLGAFVIAGLTSGLDWLRLASNPEAVSVSPPTDTATWGPLMMAVIGFGLSGFLVPVFAVFVDGAEKLLPRRAWAVAVVALLFAAAVTPTVERVWAAWSVAGIEFLGNFVLCLIVVQMYRAKGLAAAWLALGLPAVLEPAVVARSLGDAGLALQANLIWILVFGLLALGAFGYARRFLVGKAEALSPV